MAAPDAHDLKILNLLQHDADLQIEDIATRVGLSASPCWRRIKQLEKEGIIRGRVALLDREKLNVGVTVFVAVRTNQHSTDWLNSDASSSSARELFTRFDTGHRCNTASSAGFRSSRPAFPEASTRSE